MSTHPPTEPVTGGEREALLARWREARRRREAAEEIANLEIEIARTDRAMNPPLV